MFQYALHIVCSAIGGVGSLCAGIVAHESIGLNLKLIMYACPMNKMLRSRITFPDYILPEHAKRV